MYNTFQHLQVVVLTANAETITPIFNRKNFYTQSHFYEMDSMYTFYALIFVLHPQAIDKPADLFRDNQTLYQGSGVHPC